MKRVERLAARVGPKRRTRPAMRVLRNGAGIGAAMALVALGALSTPASANTWSQVSANVRGVNGSGPGQYYHVNEFIGVMAYSRPIYGGMQEACISQTWAAGAYLLALAQFGYDTYFATSKQNVPNCLNNGAAAGSYGNSLHIAQDVQHGADTSKFGYQTTHVATDATHVFFDQVAQSSERRRVDCGWVTTSRGTFRVCNTHLVNDSSVALDQLQELAGATLMSSARMIMGDYNLVGAVPSNVPNWRRDTLQINGQYPPTHNSGNKYDWVLGRPDSTFVRNNNANSVTSPSTHSDHAILISYLRN